MKGRYIIQTTRNKTSRIETFLEKYGTIFHKFDYLKSVGEDYYCVWASTDKDSVIGALPIVITKKIGLKAYFIPPYTYQFGPVISEDYEKNKGEIIGSLLKNLPRSLFFDFEFFLGDQDLLPFNENGFAVIVNQTHRFTSDHIYNTSYLSKNKKRDVNKFCLLRDAGDILVSENDPSNNEKILELWIKTAERAKFNPHARILKNIMDSDIPYYSNIILNKGGAVLAGTLCPYDKYTMYHLISASQRSHDSLLNRTNLFSLYLATNYANSKGLNFDFEGSNIPGVARFYRMMGGEPRLVYRAQKTPTIFHRILRFTNTFTSINK